MSGGGKGGSSTVETQLPPWMNQAGQFMVDQAQNLFENNPLQFFPGQTVAGFSPETQMALAGIRDRAFTGSPLEAAAQGLTLNTAQGGFLNSNPHFNQMVQGAFDPVISNVNSQFAKMGRVGSGAHNEVMTNALGDISSKLAFQNFNNERQIQNQAISQLPGLAQIDFNNLGQLAGVGAVRDQQLQQMLGSNVDRFNFENMAPWQGLQLMSSIVNGTQVPQSQTTSEDPGILGTLGGLAGLGGSLFGPLGLFCWVAREVYGADNKAWLEFRSWLSNDAPKFLLKLYLRHGEKVAGWVKRHAWSKRILRPLMDLARAKRTAGVFVMGGAA